MRLAHRPAFGGFVRGKFAVVRNGSGFHRFRDRHCLDRPAFRNFVFVCDAVDILAAWLRFP
jgi:hypothetical protein